MQTITGISTPRPIKSWLVLLQEYSLYGVFFTIPFFRLGSEIIGIGHLTPAKIFIVLTFLFWIMNILIRKDIGSLMSLFQEKANLFLFIFLVLTFVSLIFTRYHETETMIELSSRIKMFLLYFVIVGTIKHHKTLKITVAIFIIGSLITTGVGLYEVATGNSFFKENYRAGHLNEALEGGLMKTISSGAARVQGLYSDPGFHAHAMVIFLGLALPWVFYARTKKLKFIMGVLVILYMVNLIGTGSRVGWVALGCALIVFFIFMQHRYKYALGALIVLSVIIVFLASSLISHLPTTERLTLKNSISLSWRIDCYKEGLAMVRDNPVFGLGTGNYMIEYYNYLEHVPRLSRIMVGWLHNSYLLIWIENGTIGFLVFLAFMASVGLGLVWVYLEAADKEIKIIALGLLTAFVGFAVEFAGIPAIGQEMGWIILSLSVALIALNRKEKQVLSTNRLFVFCKTEGNLT